MLVGPHSHVSGATVGPDCFLATGCAVFNGAVLGRGTTVAVHGIVHVACRCPPETFVPIGYAALGDPARLYGPHEMAEARAALAEQGFTRSVFGFDSAKMSNADATRELCRRYANALARQGEERILKD